MPTSTVKKIDLSPMDKFNQTLVSNVHPSDWVNPAPTGRYNVIVIGAGSGGIVTAAGAAGLGAKAALIEKRFLGGDCLNAGCVPSKCIIRSSRAAADVRDAAEFGVQTSPGATVDFSAVMGRMRELRSKISHHDSAAHLVSQGIDVYLGEARFLNSDTIEVDGKKLRFKKAVIAAGARAVQPAIPGLAEAGYLTNETVFSLTQRPRRLACIGGGPIGCELAQAFRRLGCEVVLFHTGSHILNREDADAAEIVQQRFIREGIQLVLGSAIKNVSATKIGGSVLLSGGGKNGAEKIIQYESNGITASVAVDEILVGVGRAPNVEGLNLESVGVKYDKQAGVLVNDRLQTTNPRIYAVGDICMAYKFTHAADAAARIVIENALFFGKKKLSRLTMPWCTFTDPEIAHVGMYEPDAQKAGIPVATFMKKFIDVDRAVADGEEEGFVKVHVKKGTDQILGATIVARHAGEMLNELTLAIVHKIGLGKISSVIHPYPTQAEAIRSLGDSYNGTLVTPLLRKLLNRWFAWTR